MVRTSSPLLVVTGPTASGKTDFSLNLARSVNGAIVSADSRMVYRGLDIGTGKPTWEYRTLSTSPWIEPKPRGLVGPIYPIQGIDHYLLDVVPPEIPWTLTDWLTSTRQAITVICARGQTPVIVGGTGLYLKALINGYEPPPTDLRVRSSIEKLATPKILEDLRLVDPETATREAKNRRRLVRALEVYRLTGQPISVRTTSQPMPTKVYRLERSRIELDQRISQRIRDRLAGGMIEEVEQLLGRDIHPTWLQNLGLEYRTITEWLFEDDRKKDELIARLEKSIRAYSRRQVTFLRHQFRSVPITVIDGV